MTSPTAPEKRALIKGPLKPPSRPAAPISYTQRPRGNNEVAWRTQNPMVEVTPTEVNSTGRLSDYAASKGSGKYLHLEKGWELQSIHTEALLAELLRRGDIDLVESGEEKDKTAGVETGDVPARMRVKKGNSLQRQQDYGEVTDGGVAADQNGPG